MELDFSKGEGLIPAVVQDAVTREVLMVGFMNDAAVRQTQATGRVTFWSRSKGRLWEKGETSGCGLRCVELRVDCDRDTVLILAIPEGPTCHTGARSCFSSEVSSSASRGIGFLGALFELITARRESLPEGSYTTSLFKGGHAAIAAKVEEEAEEVVRAAREESDQRVAEEAADVLYHLWVLLAERRVDLKEVIAVLEARHRE